jgi:predicted dehydrogenase
MVEQLRFGVVGMGHRGQGWLRTLGLHPQARVVTVCDSIPPLRTAGAALAGLSEAEACARLDDLLGRPDVDAVVVAVEPRRNAAVVAAALAAGKHVLCEVPLSLTLEDCWRVVLAAEGSGRTLALAEQACHAPFVFAWQDLIASGRLGKVVYGEAQYINGKGLDRYWRDARTGARLTWEEARANPHAERTHFWDLYHVILYTTHSLAPLLRALDDRVVQVTCMGTRRPSTFLREAVGEDVALPDIEVALMRTAEDAILRLAVGFVAPLPGPEPHHWYHLLGTRGEVETGRRRGERQPLTGAGSLIWLADHYLDERVEVNWEFSPYDARGIRAARSGHGGLDYHPLHDFIESVVDGRRPTLDVYRAADLAAAAVQAACSDDQGAAPLAVPDFRPNARRRAGQAPPPDGAVAVAGVPTGVGLARL